ncbi:unnamed protein product [Nezara viridula]|uniref:Uncharacterized protein n=1 Tax=Nezara viridula TaxID=85310 RepID=A0A9P0MM80_NEZVI|nr:unnamed protein product [Nezara viridula]
MEFHRDEDRIMSDLSRAAVRCALMYKSEDRKRDLN